MNESAAEKVATPTLLLKTLQDILYNRITQKKVKMHRSHNMAYTDTLWT
jgi:hypothetical protein